MHASCRGEDLIHNVWNSCLTGSDELTYHCNLVHSMHMHRSMMEFHPMISCSGDDGHALARLVTSSAAGPPWYLEYRTARIIFAIWSMCYRIFALVSHRQHVSHRGLWMLGYVQCLCLTDLRKISHTKDPFWGKPWVPAVRWCLQQERPTIEFVNRLRVLASWRLQIWHSGTASIMICRWCMTATIEGRNATVLAGWFVKPSPCFSLLFLSVCGPPMWKIYIQSWPQSRACRRLLG